MTSFRGRSNILNERSKESGSVEWESKRQLKKQTLGSPLRHLIFSVEY